MASAPHAAQHRIATVKVGMLTMISLAVLISTVIWLRGRGFGSGQPFEVLFKDVDGLKEGAQVQLMGIRIGFIDDVTPVVMHDKQGMPIYRVSIKFSITDPKLKLPRGSVLTLEQTGLIGEKFLEITPPRARQGHIKFPQPVEGIMASMPVVVAFKDQLMTVGKVDQVAMNKSLKMTSTQPDYIYDFVYTLNQPGYAPPTRVKFKLQKNDQGQTYLQIMDKAAMWMMAPNQRQYFTMEEPLRLKDFLEEQLASAEALKVTNDKIDQLLSDDTILTIQKTLKNSQELTTEATSVLRDARKLFSETTTDVHSLVASTNQLSRNVSEVSKSVNSVIGDPKTQANLRDTIASVQAASQSLNATMSDPNLHKILADTEVTSKNAAETMQYLKTMTVDNDLQARLNQSLTLLNTSLTRLSNLIQSIDDVSNDKQSMKSILEETKETSENLNKFSEKLNKHFLLFRLSF